MATQPRKEQIKALFENDKGGPVRMMNLLKFREFAKYSDGEKRVSKLFNNVVYGI